MGGGLRVATLKLGVTKYRALDGNTYQEIVAIAGESKSGKAILLQIIKRGRVSEHWIPKSVCTVTDGRITIADWFYEKEMAQ